jgi:hypothetical protein
MRLAWRLVLGAPPPFFIGLGSRLPAVILAKEIDQAKEACKVVSQVFKSIGLVVATLRQASLEPLSKLELFTIAATPRRIRIGDFRQK